MASWLWHELRRVELPVVPLLSIHENVCQQQGKFDNEVRRLAKLDDTARRLMTVPGSVS
ncbi:hypothetical protein ABIB90_007885 [Bradyrhizobium sp. JR4.1]